MVHLSFFIEKLPLAVIYVQVLLYHARVNRSKANYYQRIIQIIKPENGTDELSFDDVSELLWSAGTCPFLGQRFILRQAAVTGVTFRGSAAETRQAGMQVGQGGGGAEENQPQLQDVDQCLCFSG